MKKIDAGITEFLSKTGIRNVDSLAPLASGGNNRVYRLNYEYLLKMYFRHPGDTRDRLNAEFSFLKYAWDSGLMNIPYPFLADAENNAALYSFIEGERPEKVEESVVLKAADLFYRLNVDKSNALNLPEASDSCSDTASYIQNAQKRIDRLTALKKDRELTNFVENLLLPSWKKIRKNLEKFVHSMKPEEKCISPSDFGFHNSIINNTGKIFFIDFEYAGWDDPLKMVCDFFCQPEIQVPFDFLDIFVKYCGLEEALKDKVKVFMPLHRIKWCCIMLNDFLPVDAERRNYAVDGDETERRKKQLRKTLEYYNEHIEGRF